MWLQRYINAYRVLEEKESYEESDLVCEESESWSKWRQFFGSWFNDQTSKQTLTCRQFLSCFVVLDGSQARLSEGIDEEKRFALSKLLFEHNDSQVTESLKLTRLASFDTQTLFADFVLFREKDVSFGRMVDLLKRISFQKKMGAEEACPVMLERVLKTRNLTSAGRLANAVLQVNEEDVQWKAAKNKIDSLITIMTLVLHEELLRNVNIESADSGSFSLFNVFATIEVIEKYGKEEFAPKLLFDKENVKKLQELYRAHFEMHEVLQCHVVFLLVRSWSSALMSSMDKSAIPMTPSKDPQNQQETENSSEDEEEEVSSQSRLLSYIVETATQQVSDLSLPLCYFVWDDHLSSLFWKGVCLMETAAKVPSDHILAKMFNMSLADFRHFFQCCQTVLQSIGESSETPSFLGSLSFDKLSFPKLPDPLFTNCMSATIEKQSDFAHLLLLVRVIKAVLKYKIRGVHVISVLPAKSSLRDHLSDLDSSKRFPGERFTEFQRREIILRLLPHNNALAISLARETNVDIASIRKTLDQLEKMKM